MPDSTRSPFLTSRTALTGALALVAALAMAVVAGPPEVPRVTAPVPVGLSRPAEPAARVAVGGSSADRPVVTVTAAPPVVHVKVHVGRALPHAPKGCLAGGAVSVRVPVVDVAVAGFAGSSC